MWNRMKHEWGVIIMYALAMVSLTVAALVESLNTHC
jgi:CHASE1-domain containing sensor protein